MLIGYLKQLRVIFPVECLLDVGRNNLFRSRCRDKTDKSHIYLYPKLPDPYSENIVLTAPFILRRQCGVDLSAIKAETLSLDVGRVRGALFGIIWKSSPSWLVCCSKFPQFHHHHHPHSRICLVGIVSKVERDPVSLMWCHLLLSVVCKRQVPFLGSEPFWMELDWPMLLRWVKKRMKIVVWLFLTANRL